MPINTLATATLFQNTLDKVAIREAVTGWMQMPDRSFTMEAQR